MKDQESLNARHSRDTTYLESLERFPKPGAKLQYRRTHHFWFTNIIANAERELRVGEIYTLRTIDLASSWACITLEETGDHEFALGFFVEVPATDDVMRWYRGHDIFRSAVTLIQHTVIEKLLQQEYRFEMAWPDLNYYPEETHMFVRLRRPMQDGREVVAIVSEDGCVNGEPLDEYLSNKDWVWSDDIELPRA